MVYRAQESHEYLIDQLQQTGIDTISALQENLSNQYRMNFNHPCKEVVWVFQRQVNAQNGGNIAANDWLKIANENQYWLVHIKKMISYLINIMSSKNCIDCKLDINISEYSSFKRKSGIIYTLNRCKKCEALRRRIKYKTDNKRKNTAIKYYKENISKIKAYQKEYHKIEHVSKRRNDKRRKRRKSDNEYRIYCNISSRLNKILKWDKIHKSNSTIKLLGCSYTEFKKWLEWQFDTNMNWQNYNVYWNIDHVIPCSSFNLSEESEQYKCFNWKNCRPLEIKKNIKKSNKLCNRIILLHDIRVKYYVQHFQIAGNSLEP